MSNEKTSEKKPYEPPKILATYGKEDLITLTQPHAHVGTSGGVGCGCGCGMVTEAKS